MLKELNEYKYFDTPEGEDTFKKIWCVSKDAAIAATGFATLDVLLHHQNKGYLVALGRYGYYLGPVLGMTIGFVAVTNLARNAREKDDKINWALGACTAGTVLGACRRSIGVGLFASTVFTGMAILKKHALQHDWTLIDHPQYRQESGIHPFSFDWTLTAERPGNWTKCPPVTK